VAKLAYAADLKSAGPSRLLRVRPPPPAPASWRRAHCLASSPPLPVGNQALVPVSQCSRRSDHGLHVIFPHHGVGMQRFVRRFAGLPRADKALLIAMAVVAIAVLPCYILGLATLVADNRQVVTPTPTRQRLAATATRVIVLPSATSRVTPTLAATPTAGAPLPPTETLEPTPTQFVPPTPEPTQPGATPSVSPLPGQTPATPGQLTPSAVPATAVVPPSSQTPKLPATTTPAARTPTGTGTRTP
jgi:hypothetical protein